MSPNGGFKINVVGGIKKDGGRRSLAEKREREGEKGRAHFSVALKRNPVRRAVPC